MRNQKDISRNDHDESIEMKFLCSDVSVDGHTSGIHGKSSEKDPLPSPPSHREMTLRPTSPHDTDMKSSLREEVIHSLEIVCNTKLNWLLLFGPIALLGNFTGSLGEPVLFCLAGLALIPCAERLSLVTEHVAEHTNGTIGALLNATFGNAPEFLISSSALRSGFYRVVQLTLLGSIITNLLFVFGLSCFIGGLRWQVQELRITSGNASIGMLLTATTGLVLPAALKMGNESYRTNAEGLSSTTDDSILTDSELAFSRFNACIMVLGYILYVIFQLGTHKEEFDYDGEEYAAFGGGHNIIRTPKYAKKRKKRKARKNKFCRRYYPGMSYCPYDNDSIDSETENEDVLVEFCGEFGEKTTDDDVQIWNGTTSLGQAQYRNDEIDVTNETTQDRSMHELSRSKRNSHTTPLSKNIDLIQRRSPPQSALLSSQKSHNELTMRPMKNESDVSDTSPPPNTYKLSSAKTHLSDDPLLLQELEDGNVYEIRDDGPMTMRLGIVWLWIITLSISLMSDIIVDTIDGFAQRSQMSEVFTSVVIIPYFSNIAEQVSAFIFAWKNEMDLCIGVTVGSALQIALFVMPGCVVVGWSMDRSMSLFFRAYETICLLLGVLCVAAVLQGGTTNWLVGTFFVGIYLMVAGGFWFHESEDLSTDNELFIHNGTSL